MPVETRAFDAPAPAFDESAGLPNPVRAGRRIHAVLFDLDGTLYRQGPLRRSMAFELARFACANPLRARQLARALSAYRRAQESVRGEETSMNAAARQLQIAAERAGIPETALEQIVSTWMIERPLKHLMAARASGLIELLDFLERHGVRAGVLSDYPAAVKLRALGIAHRFSLVLSASDDDVQVFKPHPQGFRVACRRWNLAPEEVLFVGDRAEVDAAGAAAAGMPCVLVHAGRSRETSSEFVSFPSLERLHRVLDNNNAH